MRWPLLHISAPLPSCRTETMTSESLEQLATAKAKISDLRGYL